MVTRLLLFFLVALGGAGLTLQMAWNSRLRAATGSPVLTTIISVFVTLLSLALVWASGATSRGVIPEFNSLPRWAWQTTVKYRPVDARLHKEFAEAMTATLVLYVQGRVAPFVAWAASLDLVSAAFFRPGVSRFS